MGAKEEEDLSSVLKEGRKIGDSYYLVEMSTDGRTLTISAYDGNTQQTLELLINEKNHRKLHKECDGDYSKLSTRLAVDGDRLLLRPPEHPPQVAFARVAFSYCAFQYILFLFS